MTQHPCPNCRGYKLNAFQAIIDKKTGYARELKSSTGWIIGMLVFGIPILALSLSGETKSITGIILGGGLVVFAILAVMFPTKMDGYIYHCEICGKEFFVGNGQPWPKPEENAMTGANAIKAVQQYATEQERKKKEQELAEAAHFLEQQKHK